MSRMAANMDRLLVWDTPVFVNRERAPPSMASASCAMAGHAITPDFPSLPSTMWVDSRVESRAC